MQNHQFSCEPETPWNVQRTVLTHSRQQKTLPSRLNHRSARVRCVAGSGEAPVVVEKANVRQGKEESPLHSTVSCAILCGGGRRVGSGGGQFHQGHSLYRRLEQRGRCMSMQLHRHSQACSHSLRHVLYGLRANILAVFLPYFLLACKIEATSHIILAISVSELFTMVQQPYIDIHTLCPGWFQRLDCDVNDDASVRLSIAATAVVKVIPFHFYSGLFYQEDVVFQMWYRRPARPVGIRISRYA